MANAQQIILEGVRDALIDATDAGARVYLDRPDRLQLSELPALLVQESPEGEVIEPATVSGMEQRVFSVVVQCAVAHGSTYASGARELGAQVERVLGVPSFAVPKAGRTRISASRIVIDGDGETTTAAREQLWRITYFTRRGVPETAS